MPTATLAQLETALQERMQADPALSHLLALVGRWLLEVAESARPGTAPGADGMPDAPAAALERAEDGPRDAPVGPFHMTPPSAQVDQGTPEANPEPDAAAEPPRPEQIAQLLSRFDGASVSPVVARAPAPRGQSSTAPQASRRPSASLEGTARRLELKADACQWAVRRCRAAEAGDGFAPVRDEYDTLRTRAGTIQPCYLWMLHHEAASIPSEDWVSLEGCYRACAEVLRTILRFPAAYEASPELLRLLGEAQSAIRAGMAASGALPRWIDADQQEVFEWCRSEGEFRQVYNPYLSLDHLADPSLYGGLLARIRRLHDDLQSQHEATRRRRRGFNTIRYHIGQLEDGQQEAPHHWQRIAEGIEEVLASGAPPSLPELVELLAPIADDAPASFEDRPGVRLVMRYVDQRLAVADLTEQAPPASREPTREVLLVREGLRGATIVLIGGQPRPHAKELLERELELAEVVWMHSEEHQSISTFEPAIARAETRLVIIMVRWSSHSYESIQEICERYDKVFIRLPRGYNPAQVAHEIIAQASGQLGID